MGSDFQVGLLVQSIIDLFERDRKFSDSLIHQLRQKSKKQLKQTITSISTSNPNGWRFNYLSMIAGIWSRVEDSRWLITVNLRDHTN